MNFIKMTLGVLVLLLTACSSVVIDNHADGKAVANNAGILVVGLHSDWEDYKGPVSYQLALSFAGEGDSTYAGRELVFQGTSYYSVIQLPANNYHFGIQKIGLNLWNFDKNEFIIKPNTITYIGNITSNLSGDQVFKVDDQFTAAKQYLSSHYPQLLKKYKLEKKLIPLQLEAR